MPLGPILLRLFVCPTTEANMSSRVDETFHSCNSADNLPNLSARPSGTSTASQHLERSLGAGPSGSQHQNSMDRANGQRTGRADETEPVPEASPSLLDERSTGTSPNDTLDTPSQHLAALAVSPPQSQPQQNASRPALKPNPIPGYTSAYYAILQDLADNVKCHEMRETCREMVYEYECQPVDVQRFIGQKLYRSLLPIWRSAHA